MDAVPACSRSFNRAEALLCNNEEQHYWNYNNGAVSGNYQSLEEFVDGYLNEKIDVYSLRHAMNTILTDLRVCFDEDDNGTMQDAISDTRSTA